MKTIIFLLILDDKLREMHGSPTLNEKEMKMLFDSVQEVSERFTTYFIKKSKNKISVDLKDIFARFTNDVITSITFGIECDSLKEPNNKYFLMGTRLVNKLSGIHLFLLNLCPTFFKVHLLQFN